MGNKRKLHHYYTRIRSVRPSVLVALLLVTSLVSAVALRQNNLRMIELREQVFIADEKGEGVDEALNELRSYVYGHMNTDLNSGGLSIKPPIQLKYTYERLVSAEQERITEKNKALNAQAAASCEARFPAGHIQERARCVQEYVTTRGGSEEVSIPKELYQFDFASPTWSPDLAGWSLLLSVLLLITLVVRLAIGLWIKRSLD